MKKQYVIMGALDGEIRAFRERLRATEIEVFNDYHFFLGTLDSHQVILVRSGVGKVLSALVTQYIIDHFQPDGLIFTGIAGSLKKTIPIGTIVAGKDSIQHDVDVTRFKIPRGQIPETSYRYIQSDSAFYKAALSVKNEKYTVISGRILTGDQFISDLNLQENSYLTEELSGDCVDMEGASVALVCEVNKIPHLILRTISDNTGRKEKVNLRNFLKETSLNSIDLIVRILNRIDH